MTDREKAYSVQPFLDDSSLGKAMEKLKPYESCSLIVYNTKDNLDFVIKTWEQMIGFKRDFSINFINPFSKTEKRWVIYPATHNLVTDKSKIKQSLKVLFSNVEATTEKEIEKIVE